MVLCASLAMGGTAQAQTIVSADDTLDAVADGAQLIGSFTHNGTATTHTITIDMITANSDLGAVTNANTNANGLVFNIVDSENVAANTLTLTGDAAASNDGFITFNVGEGTTQPVNFAVAGNITEADSGVTAIVLGNSGGDQAVNLRFASGAATQTIDAAISVVDDADNVSLNVGDAAVTSTTTFNDTITLRAGDTITIGAAAETHAVFMADVVAPGGITLSGNATTSATFADDVTANITLDATGGAQTLTLGASGATTTATGSIDVTNTTFGATFGIADGANVTLAGDINAAVPWVNPITVGGGTTATTFTLQGDVAANANMTLNNLATLVIDSTGGTRTVDSTINADAAGSTVALQTVGGNGVSFNVDVGAALTPIDTLTLGDNTTFAGALRGGDLSAATGVTATLEANSFLTGDITGAGNLVVGNAAHDRLTLGGGAGTSSTVSIAGIGGQGDIFIVGGSSVTFNSTYVGTAVTSDFDMWEAGSTLTINSTGTTAITLPGTLTLDAGTIVLGSNIGAGDTVFDVGDLDQLGVDTTVQLSVAFTNGAITFVDSVANEADELPNLVLVNNALATYAWSTVAEDAATDNLVIDATARTAADTATQLGVSSQVANTVLQAVTSASTAGDTTGLNALSAEINAGGTRATQAANQIGVQGDVVGASSGVAFQISGQQYDLASNRLGGLRGASDGRFASAFSSSSESGFSGGDLDGFYAYPPETRGSIWFEGFGGIASADGDTNAAGYDAAFGGATIGIDGTISDQVTVGVLGAYTASSVDGDGAGNAQMDANTYQVALYGSYTTDDFYLDGFAGYAYTENELTRTAVGQTITADYGSSQFTVGMAGGVPFEVASQVYLTPNASLTYNHYSADSYTETGSLGFSSRVTPDSVSQLTGTIGARIHAVYENVMSDGTSMVPELRIGLGYDIIDDDAVSTATFTGGGTSYSVTGTNTDDLAGLVGVGLSFDNPDWTAGIAYDADIRSDFMSHTASAEYRFRF
ncbi:MAG: hypothetical protein Rhims3KO_06520 [Hyphomicrobiales bacterium]